MDKGDIARPRNIHKSLLPDTIDVNFISYHNLRKSIKSNILKSKFHDYLHANELRIFAGTQFMRRI